MREGDGTVNLLFEVKVISTILKKLGLIFCALFAFLPGVSGDIACFFYNQRARYQGSELV